MRSTTIRQVLMGAALASALLGASRAEAATSDRNRCTAEKLVALGVKIKAELRCWQRAHLKNAPVDQACLDKARNKLAVAFHRADTRYFGSCGTQGADALSGPAQPFIRDSLAAIHGAVPCSLVDGNQCGAGAALPDVYLCRWDGTTCASVPPQWTCENSFLCELAPGFAGLCPDEGQTCTSCTCS